MPTFTLVAMRTVAGTPTSHLTLRIRHESQARVTVDLLPEAIEENVRGERRKKDLCEVGQISTNVGPLNGGIP